MIYYFKEESEDDDSPNIGEIPLSKVVRVEDKDMSQSRDKGHTFIVIEREVRLDRYWD